MKRLTEAFERLTTDSRELLLQCENAIVEGVVAGTVRPSQVALLLVQHFTPTSVATRSGPFICLLDLMLLHSSRPDPAADPSRAISLQSVLAEVWVLIRQRQELFSTYPTAIDRKPVREKGIRMVKRWLEKHLVSSEEAVEAVEFILARMRGEQQQPPADSAVDAKGHETAASEAAKPSDGDAATTSNASSSPSSSVAAAQWTKSEADSLQRLLASCLASIQALPPPRACAYASMLVNVHMASLTRQSVAVLREVEEGARRELEKIQRPANTAATAAPAKAQAADAANPKVLTLAQLLDSLDATQQQQTGAEDSLRQGGSVPGAGEQASYGKLVVITPLSSDTNQRVSVGHRRGFGDLQRRPVSAGRSDLYYYPRAAITPSSGPAAAVGRPFHIPPAVLQASETGRGTRSWFPTVREWNSQQDSAVLALYSRTVRQGNSLQMVAAMDEEVVPLGQKRGRAVEE